MYMAPKNNELDEIKTGLNQEKLEQSRVVDRRVAISNLFIYHFLKLGQYAFRRT